MTGTYCNVSPVFLNMYIFLGIIQCCFMGVLLIYTDSIMLKATSDFLTLFTVCYDFKICYTLI